MAAKVDETEFERLLAPHRTELHAHCYRMLRSVSDADDALQEALLGAWRGLAGFEGRSSLRSWLFRITTNACFQLFAVNLACLDDVTDEELANAPVRYVNGRQDDWQKPLEGETRHL